MQIVGFPTRRLICIIAGFDDVLKVFYNRIIYGISQFSLRGKTHLETSYEGMFVCVIADVIRKTCPCNEYPLKPHFYIVKLGYAGVYLFF